MNGSTEILVTHGPDLQGKIQTVVGVMPAKTLVMHHDVPYRKTLEGTGYQRNPASSRVSALARSLRDEEVDLPTAVLLNLRGAEADDVLVKTGTDTYLFCLDGEEAKGKHRLFVVDGQHRILGLQKALEDGVRLENKKIPFVCMIGADELQEMRQFHVVNSTAKSVPTDLALDLLRVRAEHDPAFRNQLDNRGRGWQVEAQELTERLAQTSPIWRNRIRLPNMPKGETTVPSASFVKSLKVHLTQIALFRGIKETERQAQIIDAYWEAIRRVLPEAFESPKDFNIQKGVGVDAMHSIFPVALDLARTDRSSPFNPDAYVPALKQALMGIEGIAGDGQIVDGVDFWRVGRSGASGGFAGASGKGRLAERLQSLLPAPTLE